VQYNHPYSSGLDDSPLWDEGTPIESPDINTYLVMQLDELARIAELIGATRDVPRWREQAATLTERMIAHFWDEQAGLFRATKDGRPIATTTLFNLYPLLTKRLPRAMNDRLVAHLTSPQEFWSPFPLPTVSMADPTFNPNQMWRGPTWVNINYLFIEALRACGYPEIARELRRRTLALLTHQRDIYEYYNPLDGHAPPKAASIFGWSSAVLIDLALDTSDPLPAPADAR
jgi:putative isomerase